MTSELTNRERAFSALAVRFDGDEAMSLCDFVSDSDKERFSGLIENYAAKENAEDAMESLIMNLRASENFSTIAEVHPAWILEKLKVESPRVIGMILRFLPSKHVRYILKNLEPIVCKQIPEMVESFSVDPKIIEVIRARFESSFLPMRVSRSLDELGFENLYNLSGTEMDEVLKELGILEMALGLTSIPKSAIKIVYNRLDIRDAKKLKSRLEDAEFAPAELKSSARTNLLQVDPEKHGAEKVLKMLGLTFIACSIKKGDEKLVALVMQKMDPSDGYLLKRLIDEKMRFSPVELVLERRRELVLKIVASLAREGRIDSAWSGFSPEEQEPAEVSSEVPSPADEDETKTFSAHHHSV